MNLMNWRPSGVVLALSSALGPQAQALEEGWSAAGSGAEAMGGKAVFGGTASGLSSKAPFGFTLPVEADVEATFGRPLGLLLLLPVNLGPPWRTHGDSL